MPAKKLSYGTSQKLAQALLLMLLTVSASAFADDGFSSDQVKSWKEYLKNYPAARNEYQKEQQAGRKETHPVIASKPQNMDDLAKVYPFLQDDFNDAKELQKKVTDFQNSHPDQLIKQSMDTATHVQFSENKDKASGTNVLFISKSGRLWCGSHGCYMDIYVDTGKGYQKVGSLIVAGKLFLSRYNGHVLIFADDPANPKTVEWIVKDNKIVQNTAPSPEPDSADFLAWRQTQQEAGKWPPQ